MEDTPQHIKDLQLKIWLSKTPAERLEQFIKDNDALFKFWKEAGKQLKNQQNNYPESSS